MARIAGINRHLDRQPVERFFQYSLLGMLFTGFLALASSRALDFPVALLTLAAILARTAVVAGWIRIAIAPRILSAIALAYIAFYPLDYYFLSHDFLKATIHGFCFIAAVKVLTAASSRDYFYIGAVAFVELIGAAFLSFQAIFFAWLALYILFAAAAFTSADLRRGLASHEQVAHASGAHIPWRLAGMVFLASSCVVLMGAGLFLVAPRTARAAARFFPGSQRLTGFTSSVDLGNFGAIAQDTRAVMHVLSYKGPLPEGLKWRGAALSRFDGRRWSEPPLGGIGIPGSGGGATEVAGQLQRSRRDGHRLLYRVDLASSDAGVLFIAGIPEFINLTSQRLLRTPDDTFRVLPLTGEPFSYEISAHSGAPLPEQISFAERARHLQLPPIDTRIWSLAREWAGTGTQFEHARAIERRLRSEFIYTLETERHPVRDPLAHFLFDTRRGYCEYFASAMAVMLRTLGVPSRVATGFQSGYYNDVSGLRVIRASDAHAWVEAWFEGRGWVPFDPTPSATPPPPGLLARLNVYLDAVDSIWQQWVVAYDLGHQAALVSRLDNVFRSWRRPRPDRVRWHDFRRAAGWLSGTALALLAVFFLYRRFWSRWRSAAQIRKISRSGGTPRDATVLYQQMLASLAERGYRRPAWFTPSEFVHSLPPEEQIRTLRITNLYNAARFGNDPDAVVEMVRALTAAPAAAAPR